MEQIKKIFKNLSIEMVITEERKDKISFMIDFDDFRDSDDEDLTFSKLTTQIIENDGIFSFVGKVIANNEDSSIYDIIDSRFYKFKKILDEHFMLDEFNIVPFKGINNYVLGYEAKGVKSLL